MNQAPPGGTDAGCTAVTYASEISLDINKNNFIYRKDASAADNQDYPSSGTKKTRQLWINVVLKAQRRRARQQLNLTQKQVTLPPSLSSPRQLRRATTRRPAPTPTPFPLKEFKRILRPCNGLNVGRLQASSLL